MVYSSKRVGAYGCIRMCLCGCAHVYVCICIAECVIWEWTCLYAYVCAVACMSVCMCEYSRKLGRKQRNSNTYIQNKNGSPRWNQKKPTEATPLEIVTLKFGHSKKRRSRETVAESFLQTKHWVILIRLILWTAECQRYDSKRRRSYWPFLIPSRALYLGVEELPTIDQTRHSSIILWISIIQVLQPRHSQRSSLNQALYEPIISHIWIRNGVQTITLNHKFVLSASFDEPRLRLHCSHSARIVPLTRFQRYDFVSVVFLPLS